MKCKFKRGDTIQIREHEGWNNAGAKALIISDPKSYGKHYDVDLRWLGDAYDGSQEYSEYTTKALILIKSGKKGKPVDLGLPYKIFKTSCNNFEETLYAKNDTQAKLMFRKKYKTREGYYITKTLLESYDYKKVMFK